MGRTAVLGQLFTGSSHSPVGLRNRDCGSVIVAGSYSASGQKKRASHT